MVACHKGYRAPFSSQLAHLLTPSRCRPIMPSDVEMSDCDSSPFDGQIDLDPTISGPHYPNKLGLDPKVCPTAGQPDGLMDLMGLMAILGSLGRMEMKRNKY